jgi:hypothetical protein
MHFLEWQLYFDTLFQILLNILSHIDYYPVKSLYYLERLVEERLLICLPHLKRYLMPIKIPVLYADLLDAQDLSNNQLTYSGQ